MLFLIYLSVTSVVVSFDVPEIIRAKETSIVNNEVKWDTLDTFLSRSGIQCGVFCTERSDCDGYLFMNGTKHQDTDYKIKFKTCLLFLTYRPSTSGMTKTVKYVGVRFHNNNSLSKNLYY